MLFSSPEIEKIRIGDVDTFELLFRQYYQPLSQFIYRFVQDQNVAEDIIQDIFLHVWKKRKNLKSHHNIKSYLFTVAKNKSLKYLRHVKIKDRYKINHIQPDIEENSTDNICNYNELQQEIERSIQDLPLKCRIIFCMNRFDNLTYLEIAEIQGISIKTVETHMSRALKFLQKRLGHILPIILF